MAIKRLAAKSNAFVREALRTLARSSARQAWFDSLLLDRLGRHPIVYTDSRGLRYVLYPGENARVYLEHGGNYETRETTFCARTIRSGATVLDVGANIGLYTLLFSQLVGEQGQVIAFEPAPENLRRLRANLALNDVTNVEIEGAAVSDEEGTALLHLFGTDRNALHSLARVRLADESLTDADKAPSSELNVPTVTLDGFCARHGIEHVDFLKVDVEGAELHVLEGASGLLDAGRVDVVQFEVSLPQVKSFDRDPAHIFEFLRQHGFHTFRFDAAGNLIATDTPIGIFANYVARKVEDA